MGRIGNHETGPDSSLQDASSWNSGTAVRRWELVYGAALQP